MTSTFTPGAPASSSRTSGAAASTCSKLSSSSSACLSRRYSSSASRAELSRPFLDPELAGDRPRDESRVGDAAELDEHGARGRCPRDRRSPRAPGASSPIRRHRSASGAAPPRGSAARGSPAARASAPRMTTSDSPGSAPPALRRLPGLGGDEIERRILVEDRSARAAGARASARCRASPRARASHRDTPRARPPAFPSGRARA